MDKERISNTLYQQLEVHKAEVDTLKIGNYYMPPTLYYNAQTDKLIEWRGQSVYNSGKLHSLWDEVRYDESFQRKTFGLPIKKVIPNIRKPRRSRETFKFFSFKFQKNGYNFGAKYDIDGNQHMYVEYSIPKYEKGDIEAWKIEDDTFKIVENMDTVKDWVFNAIDKFFLNHYIDINRSKEWFIERIDCYKDLIFDNEFLKKEIIEYIQKYCLPSGYELNVVKGGRTINYYPINKMNAWLKFYDKTSESREHGVEIPYEIVRYEQRMNKGQIKREKLLADISIWTGKKTKRNMNKLSNKLFNKHDAVSYALKKYRNECKRKIDFTNFTSNINVYYDVLLLLYNNKGLSKRKIIEKVGGAFVKKSKLIDSLRNNGLVQVDRSHNNYLTPTGRELVHALCKSFDFTNIGKNTKGGDN